MKYVALLRAVNVGGKNTIKMAKLQEILEAQGIEKPRTYIQSGNLVVEWPEDAKSLHRLLEKTIEDHFGLSIDVVLRSVAELDDIMANCPFHQLDGPAKDVLPDSNVYVALLSGHPTPDDTKRLERYASDHEHFQVVGKDIYLFLEHGMRNSKLAPQLQKISTVATVRNWKTLHKLHTLAH